MFAIIKRELKTYFLTPTGYIFLGLFLLITGLFFAFSNIFTYNTSFAPFLSSIVFLFMLCVPILTMRLMTDEKRQNTDQLLLTSPVKIIEIVLGKYFAAVLLFLIALGVTLIYPILISIHGSLDTWETIGAYIGFIFLGCSFISIGLLVSTATENQVVAAIVTFVALLIVWILDFIQQAVPSGKGSGIIFLIVILAILTLWIYFSTKNLLITIFTGIAGAAVFIILFFLKSDIFPGLIGKSLSWISLVSRYNSFSMGILKIDAIIYFITFSGFFNYLTLRLIEKRRWS